MISEVKAKIMELFKYFGVKISRRIVEILGDRKYSYNSYKTRIAGR